MKRTAVEAHWLEPSPREREVVGSIPDRVIPKSLKTVPDASLLSAITYKDRFGFSLLSNLVKKMRWILSGMIGRE